jgi:hypothetical protein
MIIQKYKCKIQICVTPSRRYNVLRSLMTVPIDDDESRSRQHKYLIRDRAAGR